jgi:hypothetical protein
MKIRYEAQTSLGNVKRCSNLTTASTSDPQTRKVSHTAQAMALIVAMLLLANASSILPQVIQIEGLLFGSH